MTDSPGARQGALGMNPIEARSHFGLSAPPGAFKRPLAFSYENPFCMGILYGRAGRLTVENGGFRPGQLGDHLVRPRPGFLSTVPACPCLAPDYDAFGLNWLRQF